MVSFSSPSLAQRERESPSHRVNTKANHWSSNTSCSTGHQHGDSSFGTKTRCADGRPGLFPLSPSLSPYGYNYHSAINKRHNSSSSSRTLASGRYYEAIIFSPFSRHSIQLWANIFAQFFFFFFFLPFFLSFRCSCSCSSTVAFWFFSLWLTRLPP